MRIAVLLPCRDEAAAIGGVVKDFRAALPDARIYVYDNCSTDNTSDVARAAGAVVRRENRPGKGQAVRRMFADIEADVYLLADGDGTYDAAAAPQLVRHLIDNQLDFVNGARVQKADKSRAGHQFGNWFFSRLISWMFGHPVRDMLSGYKVFSRRFVKSFPALSSGFEIETEITTHALVLRLPMDEIDTPYHERADGTVSKLRTFRDGTRILLAVMHLSLQEFPFRVLGLIALLTAVISLLLGVPVICEYLQTGLVPRLPTAILAATMGGMAFVCFISGVILNTVTHGRYEMRRLHYLALPAKHDE